jgi:hypothetical protein
MKHIFKAMLLPVMALPLLFASCEKDDGSNPTLNLSHASDGFVLNVPANSANNVYDLSSAEGVMLTCSQPNYGGVPYVTRYYVQVAIDEKFKTDSTTAHKELSKTSYTSAQMLVSASELNDSVVKLFQEANPDDTYPATNRPVYIRLRAVIDGINAGLSYSNVITLPSVKATYVEAKEEMPANLFVKGTSILDGTSWKAVPQVYGVSGDFFTVVYIPANGSFVWGPSNSDARGYSRLKEINDNAGATVSEAEDGGVKFEKAGWYVLRFTGALNGTKNQYTLFIYPAKAYVIGNAAGGSWTDADPAWELTAPNAAGQWVSPAFTAAGELRAYVKVPGHDWWRTEYTLYKGTTIYWRDFDIPGDWIGGAKEKAKPAKSDPENYSVTCSPGQKLYVDFGMGTGEVK